MADAKNTIDETQRKREREEDLWFDDGSVILVAQDREFRVHRSLLSRDSSVFRDMFSFPQPADMLTGEHDCPIVVLSDDVGYLRNLLRVIYDRDFYKESSLDRMVQHERIEISTGIMCLAHKYDMNDLFFEALWRLHDIYPASLYGFAELGHIYSDMHTQVGGSAALIRLTNVASAIPVPELSTMLPTLFYLCAQLKDAVLLNGASREDGTLERLQSHNLSACIEGRASLVTANTSNMLCFRPMLRNLDPRCKTQNACFTALVKMVCDALEEGMFTHADPLRDMGDWMTQGNIQWKICPMCVQHLMRRHKEAQEETWSNLAVIFHLDTSAVQSMMSNCYT